MMKFFVVGKHSLLTGVEEKKGFLKFSLGRTLACQLNFAEVLITKSGILIKKKFISKIDYADEGLNLLIKILAKNFAKCTLFIDKEMLYDLNIVNANKLKVHKDKKFNKLTDVYYNPDLVPWNFVPTEIEEILSYFPHNLLKNKKVLYIGAGYGKNLWAIKKERYNIDAIEFSEKAVNRANEFFNKKIIIKKNLSEIGVLKKEGYDIILDIGCIHSIPSFEREQATKNIYDALKHGGILISRIFKPRSKKWISRMPFHIDNFGLNSKEINDLFINFNKKYKYKNKDYIILEAKKC